MAKKVKYINDRISFLELPDELTIVMLSKKNDLKSALLFAWLICWSLIGLVMIYYLLVSDLNRENKLYIFIFLIFWLYFEIIVMKGFLWRKSGKELIRINKDGLQIKNDINGYGKLKTYFLENISNLKPIEIKKNSIIKELDASYWNLGGDRLMFDYVNRPVKFAKELEEKDTFKILKLIRSKLKELIKQDS